MDLMVRRWRLWGDNPGGNREAVSLNRVADTLDDRALMIHAVP